MIPVKDYSVYITIFGGLLSKQTIQGMPSSSITFSSHVQTFVILEQHSAY